MGIWALYIVSVIMAWLSGRYLALQSIGTKSTIEGGVALLIVPFIPVMNFIIIGIAISNMIMNKSVSIENFILKFYMIKKNQTELEKLDEFNETRHP